MNQKYPLKSGGFEGYFVPELVSKSSYTLLGRKWIIKNYIFGYARVSAEQQSFNRQLDALRKYGVDVIYNEKMTRTQRDWPELSKLLDQMTEGDTVVIESLSRLGRSTKDLS